MDRRGHRRAGRPTRAIDVISAKGELSASRCVAAACWLALLALERRSDAARRWRRAARWRCSAMGLKQNLVGGLAFGGVVLMRVAPDRARHRRAFAPAGPRRGSAGAAVPVVATIAWALWAGVRLGDPVVHRHRVPLRRRRRHRAPGNEGATERLGILLSCSSPPGWP